MKLLSILDEDFQNYKKTSMFICTPRCDGKCFMERGFDSSICQNFDRLNCEPIIEVDNKVLIKRYLDNPITSAIVIGGMEPLLDPDDIFHFILTARIYTLDPIIIYTGYYPDEVVDFTDKLYDLHNIIVKFGRYVPGAESVYDELLGVTLVSDNQFSKQY